ncbi:hypothetical protein BRADI_2g53920v3 [Brachypodium distachyon]|uniref:Knottin scorpion toxin-like domain-containing protein n=1 Tax=Brachypodium distachyon TaxID=15368 RepID=I1HT09_BRADI|nr:hypothetical protein BRADI_2g53920v3 [Brachypodium distachyon]
MEAWRKNALCSALFVLLIVASSEVRSVRGIEADGCWNRGPSFAFCANTARCREACQAGGQLDGRCNAEFPIVWPRCECLAPHCT